MPIQDILTITDSTGERPAAAVSTELARRLDAHLTGLTLLQTPVLAVAGMASSGLSAGLYEEWRREAQETDTAFQEAARRAGIRFDSAIVDAPSDGYFAEVTRRARLTDLAVIGQDNPDAPEPLRAAMIETLLFEGGAPTLVVPYVGVKAFAPRRALVAWDGSATAARAVRGALPLLAQCESVTVLMVGARRVEEASDVAVYLDRHRLKVEIKHVVAGSLPVADALLNLVSDEDFDWVVMGAYGHSRVREYFFGGATRDILGEMTVPVLMAH